MYNKRQVIRWKEAIGENQYRSNDMETKMSIMTEAVLAVVCMLIFMLSSRIMLADVFSWGDFSGGSVVVAFILLAIVCCVMDLSNHVKNKYGIYIRYGLLLTGVMLAMLYLWMDGDIISGFQQAGQQYMVYWNKYFGFPVSYIKTETDNIEAALNFLFLVIMFLTLWIARMSRKNIIMVVTPIVVLCIELLVGYSPKELSVFLLFVGVLVANASRWTKSDFTHFYGRRRQSVGMLKHFMWVFVGAGIICFYGVVKLIGGSSAEDMAGRGKEFKQFQEEFVTDITNWSLWEMFGSVSDSGILTGDWSDNDSYKDKLTNKPLNYSNETVLTVEMEEKLYTNIYIRGYYADTYKDGVWELDYEEFEKACKKNGYDAEEMGNNILNLASSKLEDRMLYDDKWYYGKVKYKSTGSERAFYPYFIRLSDTRDVFVEGDGRYKKDEDTEELSFNMWNREGLYQYYLYKFDSASLYEWERWYESYVLDHYTKIPSGMPMVQKLADIIDEALKNNSYLYENTNEERIGAVDNLVKWFNDNTTYSKEPPQLPSGEEPVEFFLGTSKEGYCMHYATSAVLVLRTLGIPARYATGYVVDSELFKKVASKYVAEVPDSRAHAWVEIYLDGIGWTPMEVTNGYDTTNLEHIGEDDTGENIIDDETSEEVTTLPENETASEEITTLPQENDESIGDELSSDINSGMGDGDENGLGTTESGGSALKVILICVLAVTLSSGVVYVIMRRKMLYNEALMRQIKLKRTVCAIKNINRRIYRKVRIDAKIFKNSIRDDEYAEVLKKTYTDITEKEWGRFMVVVKAASFSDIELAEKEMDFCYDIYKRVMKKD